MSVFSWVRDILGIRKDAIEAKKAKLEIRKLEGEEHYRYIQKVDLKEIIKLDPKILELLDEINKHIKSWKSGKGTTHYSPQPPDEPSFSRPAWFIFLYFWPCIKLAGFIKKALWKG